MLVRAASSSRDVSMRAARPSFFITLMRSLPGCRFGFSFGLTNAMTSRPLRIREKTPSMSFPDFELVGRTLPSMVRNRPVTWYSRTSVTIATCGIAVGDPELSDEKLKKAISPGSGRATWRPSLNITLRAVGVYIKLGRCRPASLATTSMKAPAHGWWLYPTRSPN